MAHRWKRAAAHCPAAGDPNCNDPKTFDFIDVTLRDAHQCLWSTRMTTAMMTPILGSIDRAGYADINILGGAVFDVCVRYLHENPWERIGLLCKHLETPCDALTRAQSLYTFELFPDDIVALNSQVLARRGIKVLTVYDALNDNRNIESSVRSAHAAGMKVNAMMTYTVSPVHTDAYYADSTRELVALEVDFISIKDPTGLLTPERGRTLFPVVVQAAGDIPAAAAFALSVGPCSRRLRDRDSERVPATGTPPRAIGQRRVPAGYRGHRGAGSPAGLRYVDERWRRCRKWRDTFTG